MFKGVVLAWKGVEVAWRAAMPSMTHLQRNFGCSDTALASCLHPQVELSNIFDSLFKTSSLSVLILILHSSMFVCVTTDKRDTKLKLYVQKYVLCKLCHFWSWAPTRSADMMVPLRCDKHWLRIVEWIYYLLTDTAGSLCHGCKYWHGFSCG